MANGMPSLPQVSWIAELKPDDVELLTSYGDLIPAQASQRVIIEGEEQSHLYVLISGSLTIKRSTDLGDAVLATLGSGEVFGEVGMFDPGPASASVTATEFSQLWRISREELMTFMEDNPVAGNQMMMGLATTLASRLRGSDPLLGSGGNQPLSTE